MCWHVHARWPALAIPLCPVWPSTRAHRSFEDAGPENRPVFTSQRRSLPASVTVIPRPAQRSPFTRRRPARGPTPSAVARRPPPPVARRSPPSNVRGSPSTGLKPVCPFVGQPCLSHKFLCLTPSAGVGPRRTASQRRRSHAAPYRARAAPAAGTALRVNGKSSTRTGLVSIAQW